MAFLESSISGSHWFSDDGYPSHLTRYLRLLPFPRCERMASTSYSSWLSMISGGGWVNEGPWESVCRNGVRREAWNTGWMRQASGIFNLYDSGDKTCSISKGPSRFGENLQGLFGKDRLVALSHTLSPLLNGLNLLCMCHCICCLAKSWAAMASLQIQCCYLC